MLREILSIPIAVAICLLLFVGVERELSPSFQSCVNHETNNAAGQPSKEHNANIPTAIHAYVVCTSGFIVDNNPSITAFATLIIAAFTGTLWIATSRQSRLIKEAFIAEKRAFVFAASFNQLWEQDPTTNLYNWRFRPVLRNSGETPTRRMAMYVTCEVRNTPLENGYPFSPNITNIAEGNVLPPRFEFAGGLCPVHPASAITPQDIIDAQQGRKFIYLWGWIKYNDVFPRTKQHITRYCWVIIPVGDPMTFVPNTPGQPPTPGTLSFSNIHHREGNGIDDN
jgi:hypothetical protein